eukprot:30294-Pelagococcus_subviridis.AAC.48
MSSRRAIVAYEDVGNARLKRRARNFSSFSSPSAETMFGTRRIRDMSVSFVRFHEQPSVCAGQESEGILLDRVRAPLEQHAFRLANVFVQHLHAFRIYHLKPGKWKQHVGDFVRSARGFLGCDLSHVREHHVVVVLVVALIDIPSVVKYQIPLDSAIGAMQPHALARRAVEHVALVRVDVHHPSWAWNSVYRSYDVPFALDQTLQKSSLGKAEARHQLQRRRRVARFLVNFSCLRDVVLIRISRLHD